MTRVIALAQFTDASGADHHYGAEFEMPEGPELEQLILCGTVRVDDRMPASLQPRTEPSEVQRIISEVTAGE